MNSVDSRVALIIIFNHRYDENIGRLEALYSSRFSHRYYLVPFYEGTLDNVIPVYEHSYYFQGYVAQGLKSIKKRYEYYLFIADDLLLNPRVNENNFDSLLKVDHNTAFNTDIVELHYRPLNKYWKRLREAYEFRFPIKGLEVHGVMPSAEEARRIFEQKNLEVGALQFEQIYGQRTSEITSKNILRWLRFFKHRLMGIHTYSLNYPLVGGYSDIFCVHSSQLDRFALYCGVFASSRLFVELAIPTALVLSVPKLVTERDLELKGGALWTKEDYKIIEKYKYSITQLLSDFPVDLLYIHPIKLSKWK